MSSNAPIDDFGSLQPTSVTWALCWKQWCEFLSPMVVLTLCSMALLLVFGIFAFVDRRADDFYAVMFSVPTMMCICFTFVCCFVAFVSEEENRTNSFLVNLPLGSAHVGFVKILMMVLAIVIFCLGQAAMVCTGLLIANFVSGGGWEQGGDINEVLQIALFVGVTLMVSLVSCSLRSRSWCAVLTAMVLGYFCVVAILEVDTFSTIPKTSQLPALGAWSWAASLGLLVVGAIWFPLRWLRRRPWGVASYISDSIASVRSKLAESDAKGSQTPSRIWAFFNLPRGGRFGALLWQSVFQQRLVLLFCSFFLIIFSVGGFGALVNRNGSFFENLVPSLIPAFALTGLGAGWLTLQHDKKDGNLEFFQQHREHGIALMIARIIPPIAVLLVLTAIAIFYLEKSESRINFFVDSRDWERFAKAMILVWLTSYCAVVLCSMIFRSQVYALGTALVVALVVGVSISQAFSFHPEFSWMVALPFVWLLSSVAYGPRWLSQRRSWPWAAYHTIILLCAFAIPIYLLAYAFQCWCFGIEFRP